MWLPLILIFTLEFIQGHVFLKIKRLFEITLYMFKHAIKYTYAHKIGNYIRPRKYNY